MFGSLVDDVRGKDWYCLYEFVLGRNIVDY